MLVCLAGAERHRFPQWQFYIFQVTQMGDQKNYLCSVPTDRTKPGSVSAMRPESSYGMFVKDPNACLKPYHIHLKLDRESKIMHRTFPPFLP